MNTIIFTTKFLEYAVSDKDDVFVIQSKEDIEVIKEKFQKHLVAFTEKVKVLNDVVQKSAFKLTDYDYDNNTPALKDFQDKYDECEKFKKENYLFEIDGQYIDVIKFLYNDEISEYAIYSLEEWLKKKMEETSNKPVYMM